MHLQSRFIGINSLSSLSVSSSTVTYRNQDEGCSMEASIRRISADSARTGKDSKRKKANEFLPYKIHTQSSSFKLKGSFRTSGSELPELANENHHSSPLSIKVWYLKPLLLDSSARATTRLSLKISPSSAAELLEESF